MHGAYWLLFLILTAGTLSMISVGLLVAARFSSEEAANGILNLISWPMMLLSGGLVFARGFQPRWCSSSRCCCRLTHMLDAARAVMIDGAGLQDVLTELVTLFGFSALFLAHRGAQLSLGVTPDRCPSNLLPHKICGRKKTRGTSSLSPGFLLRSHRGLNPRDQITICLLVALLHFLDNRLCHVGQGHRRVVGELPWRTGHRPEVMVRRSPM